MNRLAPAERIDLKADDERVRMWESELFAGELAGIYYLDPPPQGYKTVLCDESVITLHDVMHRYVALVALVRRLTEEE